MDHHPFVHEADAQLLTDLYADRLSRGKTLAVERVPMGAVVQHQGVVHIGALDLGRSSRLHDERAEEPETDLLR